MISLRIKQKKTIKNNHQPYTFRLYYSVFTWLYVGVIWVTYIPTLQSIFFITLNLNFRIWVTLSCRLILKISLSENIF